MTTPTDIDTYIASFPKDIQPILEEICVTIKEAEPSVVEAIKYGMPTFMLNGNLVYFSAFKNHIGMYGVPTKNEDFKKDFSLYKIGKGSVQFPLDKPMPFDLITKIVKFRAKENLNRANKKTAKSN